MLSIDTCGADSVYDNIVSGRFVDKIQAISARLMFEYRLVDTVWQWQFCDNTLNFSPFLNIANHIKLDFSATLLLSYLMRFDPLRKLTEKEVKEHVHDIIGHGGELIISRHARERMMERGYGVRDIHHIIMDGTLVNAVTNQEAGNIKYTFHGPDLEGDYGSVVLALVTIRNCVVITVLSS